MTKCTTGKPFSCPTGYRPKPNSSDITCPTSGCTAETCCVQTCAKYTCTDKTKHVIPTNLCDVNSGCSDASCCYYGDGSDKGVKNAVQNFCAHTTRNEPPGTSPEYRDFVTTVCASSIDLAAIPAVNLAEGLENFGVEQYNALMNNALTTILQLKGPEMIIHAGSAIKKRLLEFLQFDSRMEAARAALMQAAESDVAKGVANGAAYLVATPLAMVVMSLATAIDVADKIAFAEVVGAVKYVTWGTAKAMMWLGEAAFGALTAAVDGIQAIGMIIDMLDPCDLQSALTGAQLNRIVAQMDTTFRSTILGSLEAVPTTQNVSVPYDEIPLSMDVMTLQQTQSLLSLVKADVPPPVPPNSEPWVPPVVTGDAPYQVLQLYHRYAATFLSKLKVNSQNNPISWPNNLSPTVRLPPVGNRLYATFMTLTDGNVRVTEFMLKYWYLVLLCVVAFVAALVLFFVWY